MVDRWIEGGPQGFDLKHPDTTLRAFLAWCARQPDGPAATLAAWRSGAWRLGP